MSDSFGAICSDFYVNQRLALKMDLPTGRETVLDLFDRIRRGRPQMDQFRRYDGELALESNPQDGSYEWMALRRTSIRSGCVNPGKLPQAYELHRLILEVAPYYLSISPLDVDYLELMFGFDLEARGNHDEIVFEALIADGPLGELFDPETCTPLDVAPYFTFALDPERRVQATIEVKTRATERESEDEKFDDEAISVYLGLRYRGPLRDITDLKPLFDDLSSAAEQLSHDKVIPMLIQPIARAINLRSC